MRDVISDPLNSPDYKEYTFDNSQEGLIFPDIESSKDETIYFKLIISQNTNIHSNLELKGGTKLLMVRHYQLKGI